MQNEARQMPGDTQGDYPRGLPRRADGLSRFLGGSPLSVAFRLVLLSILVGGVLAAIGFDPWNIVDSLRRLIEWVWNLGFDAINGLWRYFLLGAVIVIPLWLISRLFNWIYDLGFAAVNGLWRYFLLGAVIVIPVWLISRMFGAPRGR